MVVENVTALSWLRKKIETADAGLLREMVKAFAEVLMGAEVDSLWSTGVRAPPRSTCMWSETVFMMG